MAEIHTPVKGFTGKVAGVQFTDGVGETTDTAALAYFERHGYDIVPDFSTPDPEPFDPSAHSVEEVLSHLQGIDDADPEAHDAEVVRVLAAEKAGKNRKGIVEAVEGTPEA